MQQQEQPAHQHDDTRPIRVLIIGGGFAGQRAFLVFSRSQQVQCTLVDDKAYAEYTPGVLRAMVQPSHAALLSTPHKQEQVAGKKAVRVELSPGGTVVLCDGSVLAWDHLLLATGSAYLPPIKPKLDDASHPGQGEASLQGRLAALQAAAAQLRAAARVVVVGGGPVGVELAAEVASAFGRHKTVTLVCADNRLLPRMAPAAGQYATKWLQRHGVHLLLGTRVVSWPAGALHGPAPGEVVTDQGTSLTADVVYNCTGVGGALNVHLYCDLIKGQSGSDEEAIQARKSGIPVNEYLQVRGFSHIWAAGDVTDTPWEKSAYGADLQATCAAHNILRHAQGQALQPYPQSCAAALPLLRCPSLSRQPLLAVVSLGPHCAVLQLSRTCVAGWLPAQLRVVLDTLQRHLAAGNVVVGAVWPLLEAASTLLAGALTAGTSTW